jgi:hypothetical protein
MTAMKSSMLVEQINKRNWWHSPPVDQDAYKKRGIFLAGSFKECEFYGRPLDKPLKVNIMNPFIDTEENVVKKLFGLNSKEMKVFKSLLDGTARDVLKMRFQLDKKICRVAKKCGYDAIGIVTKEGLKKVREGKLPGSVELNVLDIKEGVLNKLEK